MFLNVNCALANSPLPGADAEQLISINFEDVDLRIVTNFVSKVTGKNFLLDDRVRGNVTIISPTQIPVEEVYTVFLSVLEVRGFTAIPAGRVTKIVPMATARQSSLPTSIGKEISEMPFEDKMITHLIPLEYADSQQLLAILAPLISAQGHLTSYQPTNTLIVTDTSSNIRKLLTIINSFDIEGAKLETSIISLKYASAQTISEKVSSAVESAGSTSITSARSVRGAAPRAPMSVGGGITLIPDERINSIILVANQDDTLRVRELIEQLDILPPPGRETIHIYKLKYADAEELAKVLSAMPLGKEAASKGAKPISISADVSTRSLIVTADPEDYSNIKEVIDQLDSVRPQVFLEALIADVSMDMMTDLGVEWGTVDNPVEGEYRGFGGAKYGTGSLYEKAATFSGLIIGAMKGTTSGIPNVGMIIQAYSKKTGFDILSTPQILTLDNKEAKILVGENIPYLTSSRITEQDTVVNSYAYKDVGIELTITPYIGTENNLKLDIHQKVTKLVPTATGTELPTTTIREAKTSVSVDDGSTIVIGGLIRDDSTEVLYKVPLLGDIWILGALFRRTEKKIERRNLLIFITPYIIRKKEKIEELTQNKKELQDKFKIEEAVK
ncbi:MAG: type II secretion system secretin GspD [Candidatus Omnitrophica bacterium]|nr:type II secretion system secretin GspD [Candidatus Omnitrophota bacterium]MBU1889476.1 type II secretion system secretin GspD [Candidatus Omnitrophota bacterium]